MPVPESIMASISRQRDLGTADVWGLMVTEQELSALLDALSVDPDAFRTFTAMVENGAVEAEAVELLAMVNRHGGQHLPDTVLVLAHAMATDAVTWSIVYSACINRTW